MNKKLVIPALVAAVFAAGLYFLFRSDGGKDAPARPAPGTANPKRPDPPAPAATPTARKTASLGAEEPRPSEQARDLYTESQKKAVLGFLKKVDKDLTLAPRGGCLGRDPIKADQNGMYLFDVATGQKSYAFENAEVLCAHLAMFYGLSKLNEDDSSVLKETLSSLEGALSAVSAQITNRTGSRMTAGSTVIPPGRTANAVLNVRGFCRIGGPPPALISLDDHGTLKNVEVVFCEDKVTKSASGYSVAVQGIADAKKKGAKASEPLQVKVTVSSDAAKGR